MGLRTLALASSSDVHPSTLHLPEPVVRTGDSRGLVTCIWLSAFLPHNLQRNPLQTWTHQEEGISEAKRSFHIPSSLPLPESPLFICMTHIQVAQGIQAQTPESHCLRPSPRVLPSCLGKLLKYCERRTIKTSTSLGCWKQRHVSVHKP